MGKVKYEIFNPTTGAFEEGEMDEDEALKIMEKFTEDYELYESEKKVVETIIKMQLNNRIHPKLGDLD